MNKQAFALAALIAAATTQVHAQATESFYLTAAGSSTKLNVDCAGTSACDASDTGLKLVGGYQLGGGLSVELAYLSYGKFGATVSNINTTLKPTAIMLAGAYALPLGTDWGLNVRLGLAQVKTQVNAVSGSLSGSRSESKAKVYAGVGLTYAISQTVKIELAADSTEAEIVDQKGAVRLFSLSASFAF